MEALCLSSSHGGPFLAPPPLRPPPIVFRHLPAHNFKFKFCLSSIAHSRSYDTLLAQSPAQIEQQSQLKQQLFRSIEAAQGSLDHSSLSIVSSLEQLNLVPDLTIHPALATGAFVQMKGNFKEKRTDGEQRFLGYLGSITTLGSTTFNMLNPIDLKIALFDFYQHVGIESEDSYNLIVEFSIPDPDEKSSPVQGLIINRARYAIGGSNRLEVEFLSCGMRPRFPEKDLDVWLKLLKESNPGMDENGSVVVPLPMPVNGWTDFIYMDEEIRITRGNRGGVSVLRYLKEPDVSI